MLSLTSAKAIYSTLFFTTTLSLGGVLANRSFLTATGLVGSYAGTVALLNRNKELPDSVSKDSQRYLEQKHTELELDLNNRLEQLQAVFQALQLSTKEGNLNLQQDLNSLQEKVLFQSNKIDSVSKDSQKYTELELNLNNGLEQLQAVSQALEIATQGNMNLQQDLDSLQEKVLVQSNKIDSVSKDSQGDLEQQYSELELDLNNRIEELQERVLVQPNKIDSVSKDSQGDSEQKYSDLKQNLDRLSTKVKLQHASTKRGILSDYIKLNDRVGKLENTIGQNVTTVTLQSVESSSRLSKTVVFIDQSNFHHACERIGIKPNYSSLMRMLTPEVGECEIRVYLGVNTSSYRKQYQLDPSKKQKQLKRELEELGYQVIALPIVRHSNDNLKVVGDDIKLSCDLLTMMQNGEICDRDRVVLISGDGDYKPALQQVKDNGIRVEVIAYKPSRYLTAVADQVTYLDKIRRKII